MKQEFLLRLMDPREAVGGGDDDVENDNQDESVTEEDGEESGDDEVDELEGDETIVEEINPEDAEITDEEISGDLGEDETDDEV